MAGQVEERTGVQELRERAHRTTKALEGAFNEKEQTRKARQKSDLSRSGSSSSWGARYGLAALGMLAIVYVATTRTTLTSLDNLQRKSEPHTRELTPDEQMESYVADILEWAESQGMDVAGAPWEIKYDPNSGATSKAKRDIDLKEVMFVVPRTMWIHHRRALASDIGPWLQSLEENERTIVYLMRQKLKGPSSDVWPYVQLLPTGVASLLYFTEADLDEFQDEMFRKWRDNEMAEYKELYNASFLDEDGLCVVSPQLFDCLNDYTLDLYLWASINYYSRYFSLNEFDDTTEGTLLPVADLINHNSPALCAQDNDAALFWHAPERQEYLLVANEPFPEGSDLGICYNTHTNAKLLTSYGFAFRNNRYDKTKFRGVFLSWALEDQYGNRMMSQLCDNLRAQHGQVCQDAVTHAVNEHLASFPTTIEEDLVLLNGNTITRNARSAITWRLEQKRLVAQALTGFRPITNVWWTPPGRDLYTDDGNGDTDDQVIVA